MYIWLDEHWVRLTLGAMDFRLDGHWVITFLDAIASLAVRHNCQSDIASNSKQWLAMERNGKEWQADACKLHI